MAGKKNNKKAGKKCMRVNEKGEVREQKRKNATSSGSQAVMAKCDYCKVKILELEDKRAHIRKCKVKIAEIAEKNKEAEKKNNAENAEKKKNNAENAKKKKNKNKSKSKSKGKKIG